MKHSLRRQSPAISAAGDQLGVLLNAVMLRQALTGIGHYTLRLGMGLETHPAIRRVRYFGRFAWSRHRPEQAAVMPLGEAAKSRARKIPLAADLYHGLRRACFRLTSGRAGVDIYHEPNYLLMPFDGPSISTIHDLSYLHYPQYHPKERIRRMEKGMPETLRRANHLITVSEFVRAEVIKLLGVSPEKITAIPEGADESFRARGQDECKPVLSRYGLDGVKYLLTVGTLEPRKNLLGLVAAYSRLPEKMQEDHPLAVVGMKGWLSDALEHQLEPLERRGRVRRLGYVVHEDLPFVYAGAHAFAFPSFYEGFGLPPLEAMACGIPVLISNRSSLPEVAGDVALQVEPEDIEAMTRGLERLLIDANFRARAAQNGPQRAAVFTWERCVDYTVDVYHRVLAGIGRLPDDK